MTMDVSKLGIIVESQGIDTARKALDGGNGRGGLVGAADKAERTVTKLTDSLAKMVTVNATGSAQAWNSAMSQLAVTLTMLNGNVNTLGKNLAALSPELDKATAATNKAAAAKREYSTHSGTALTTLKAMTTAALAYAGVNFATSIVKQADSWQMMTARLTNATGSLHNAQVAQQQMFDLSQRLRVPLEDSVKLYNRLAPAVQRMGKDSGYAKDMVEGIATALQLGGANGAEASSVMLQLSQSFSSGVLNGAEFNAVAENGSVLMRALEKYTGKASWELKKMGSEGKLSMQTVGEAIQKFLPEWREQFDKLPLTFEGAMQRLSNAWTKAVGEMGQDTGFNVELSKALRVVEDMIPAVARGLGESFITVMKWVSENKDKLGQIWDQVVGLGKDVWRLVGQFFEMVGVIGGAGEETSVLAAGIFGVRAVVAATVDVVKALAAAFVHVGLDIAQVVLWPITKGLELVGKLEEKFADFFSFLAKGADNAGMHDLAEGLRDAAANARFTASDSKDVVSAIDGFIQKYRNMADSWTEGLRNGRGELDNLLNGVNDLKKATATVKPISVMDEEAWNANKNPKKRVDEKALKAAQAEEDKYLKAMEDLNAKYEEQIQLRSRLEKFGADADKLSPATKTVIALQEHLNSLIDKGASETALVNAMTLLARAREVETLDLQNRKTQEALKLSQALVDQQLQTTHGLEEEALKLEQQVATYHMAKGAVEALALAEAKRRYAELDATSDGQRTPEMEARLALLGREIVARERIANATAKLGALQVSDEFDKLFDPKKAEKFGDVLAEGFGNVGKALGQMMNSFDKYEARQSKIKKGWELVNKETDPTKRAKMTERLIDEETQSRLASYADMAGAAKGFFEEGSRGYKAMEAAEKAFRLFQMAMNMKSFLQEIGLLEASTAATVTANTAKATSDVAAATVSASASMMEGTASAAAGVANQAKGDPYTAWARMAAMAAVMAALGFAVGGVSGGADVAKQRQASQGTGTVLGDASAKSESISKSLERLSANSDIALRYSSGMLTSLQAIEYNLTGATSGVIRSQGVTGRDFEASKSGASALQAAVVGGVVGLLDHYLLGGAISKVLGFGSSTSLKDSGIAGSNQSVGDIVNNGFDLKGYQDVQTKKKAFWVTYSNKTSTNYSALDPTVSKEFSNIVGGMVDTLVQAGEVLGVSGDTLRAKLEAANIDIGKISLKGLTGEEIQKQLEAVFSAIGDNLTSLALPSVEKFQKAGEGLLETAVRVASGVETADYELEKLGLTSVGIGAIANTAGDVGAELVRQSILVAEAGTGVGEIVATLSGEAGDIADTYKALIGVRTSLQGLQIADDVSRDLIRAAGGLDALKDAIDAYTSNFFTADEQNAMKASALRKEFDKLGVAMPASKADFRSLIETLSASGTSGQELAVKLMGLSGAFAEIADAYETKVADARQAVTDAYERESQALTDVKDKFLEFASSLHDFRTTLLTGDLSTLDVAGKYAAEKAHFEEVLAKAQAGDTNALADFETVAQAYLQASREMNASGTQYTSDFQRVLDATAMLEDVAAGKATVAEQQLDALNKQVDGIITVNESVLTVTQAIDALNALLAGGFVSETGQDGKTIMTPIDGSHRNGLDYVPFDGYIAELHKGEAVLTASENKAYQTMDYSQYGSGSSVALVEEIKMLREEVKNLREGQREQTGQLIAANYDANERNAQAVVEGTRDAASVSNYAERAKATLA